MAAGCNQLDLPGTLLSRHYASALVQVTFAHNCGLWGYRRRCRCRRLESSEVRF